MSQPVAGQSRPAWRRSPTGRRPRRAGWAARLLSRSKVDTTAEVGQSNARALLHAAPQSLAGLRGESLIAAVEAIERAYRQFPELELEVPRSALAGALREAAALADDGTALPLLMAGAALDQAASPALVGLLLIRMARADRGDAIAAAIASLGRWRSPGHEETAPALYELCRRGQGSAALAVLSGMLVRAGVEPERVEAELTEALRSVLPADADGDPAALFRTVLSARGRLHSTARPSVPPHRETPLLALAERVAAKLPPFPVPRRRAPTPPTGADQPSAAARLRVAAPELCGGAVEWLPGMQVGPAGERREPGIAARSGYSGHLAYGPYATLGPGDYRVRVGWRAGPLLRAASDDLPIATIEAVSRHGRTYLGQRTLYADDYDRPEQELAFRVDEEPAAAATVEVRVWTSGIAPLAISSVAVERLDT